MRRIRLYVIAAAVLVSTALALVAAQTPGSWTSPSDVTLKRVSGLPAGNHDYGGAGNIDCTPLTYRQADSDDMSTGCFSRFAGGLMDIDKQQVIYNGSDEAYPVIPPGSRQILIPWPNTGRLVSLSDVVTGGTRLGIYLNPQAQLRDNRLGLTLASRSLVAGPDKLFADNKGQPIDVNPVTLAFSPNGDWLVAETLSGSFVRINRDSLQMTPFAPWYGVTNIDHMAQTSAAISDDGRYVALLTPENSHFKVYDLNSCNGYINTWMSLPPQNCADHDYWAVVSSKFSGLTVMKHVRFLNSGLLSFEVVYNSDSSKIGTYTVSPGSPLVAPLEYLAMGDSYTSGEGAFDYLAGTDTGSNKCHLSAWSYPFLLSGAGRSVACSGAVIADVGSSSSDYRGQARGAAAVGSLDSQSVDDLLLNFTPGHLPQDYYAAHYQPHTITVSVAGNDIGFGDILKRCVMVHFGLNNNCYSSYEDRLEVLKLIDRTAPRLTDLFFKIRAAVPGVKLYVIDYPEVADPYGNCADNVRLSKSELEFAQQIIRYLDASIQSAAVKAGAGYIDISKALYGHRLCETDSSQVAMNGLTAGGDAGPIGHESYHPNALGHSLVAKSIREQTDGFNLEPQNLASGPDSGPLLDGVLRTNRPLYTLIPLQNIAVVDDRNLRVGLDGLEAGMKPNAIYNLTLDGPGGMKLGSFATDDFGNGTVVVKMPEGVSGEHFVDITGPGQSDNWLDISQALYLSPANPGINIKISNFYTVG